MLHSALIRVHERGRIRKMKFTSSFLITLLLICFIPLHTGAKKGKSQLVGIEDLKEFKKLLRTRTNFLVIFTKSDNAASKSMPMFEEVAEEMRGKTTMGYIDCSEFKKLCKNLKASPSSIELRHYKDGDFNKNYDRKMVAKSLINFLLDPTGDIPWDEEPGSETVVHVNGEQAFNKLVKKGKVPVLVMFYAPWCGYCKKLKPEFAAAAKEMKGQATLAGVDLDKPQHMSLRAEYNITGFPTLYYFADGKMQYKYGGENSKDGLVKWLKDPSPPEEPKAEVDWEEEAPEIAHLHDDTFDDFIQTHSSVLVMFYAPWCGHCKKMKPEYQEAAAAMKEQGIDGVLAAVDATKDKKLGDEYSVKGFPSVKYFKDGLLEYDFSERTADKIVEFMKDPKEPPPPPPPEQAWAETESDVVHLTEENFKSHLKRKKHGLVMFYAPWCGHCKKAKPEFMGAALQFKEDTKVTFAGLDCTAHQSVCTTHDVTGYPTFKYFNYGKSTQKYMGGREEPDFVKFMKDPMSTESSPPPPSNPPPEEQWAEVEGRENLHLLGGTNFDTFIQEHESVLVMFYAPWCGHCMMMKPAYGEAATLLKEEGLPGVLAAVDATVERDIAGKYDVKSFPTLKYFKNGKLEFEYKMGRTTDAIVGFMKNPTEPPPPPPAEPAWSSVPSEVKHLTGSNFTSYLANKEAALVMFYAPWCGHCKKAKPIFQAAAEKIDNANRILAAVDCTDTINEEVCSENDVKGFPTIKLYSNGKFLTEYDGDRSEADILEFISNAPTVRDEL